MRDDDGLPTVDWKLLVGQEVRAQVAGWKASRRGELSAPGLENTPLHVVGTLSVRSSPRAGAICSVAGYDVDDATIRPDPPALAPAWNELPEPRDTRWRAQLRLRQSWYRHEVLGLPPGTMTMPSGPRLVASMLPIEAVADDPSLNFLADDELERFAADRLSTAVGTGIVERDRLYRNLLSSQPLCFNLFGGLALAPNLLLRVLKEVFDVPATDVVDVRFEWAPERSQHLGSGSAFDCYIEYATPSGLGFVGVETKYSENLAAQGKSANPAFRAATEAPESGFRPRATDRLEATPAVRQLWYNALLAASLRRQEHYERGSVVLVACIDDVAAGVAADILRQEIHEPDEMIRHVSYESILDAVANDDENSAWCEHLRLRYFTPAPLGTRQ
jgi:PD-(D/E)XK nuclease superfamily protein